MITVIGGGLAGCEAAWQAAARGARIRLLEMKPSRFSPAHESPFLAELVCSNSLRSADPHSAVGLLKEEMRRLGSLILRAAEATRVPAGRALAVDRQRFAAFITKAVEEHPAIEVVRQEVRELPKAGEAPLILATGPLTSDSLAASLARLTGAAHLAFYDAIAPIVFADSLDRKIVYQASRYDDGAGDYLNCPMNQEQYQVFIKALATARTVPLKDFEEPKYFEGCLPIEVMLARGPDTLRFGPMKPVGLPEPRTGRIPHAVVQLRKENQEGTLYNLVGFQTKLAHPEQQRVFRMIPGLERAEFARLGSIHRNTFVCAPQVLLPTLQLRQRPDLLLAGQISGVEGYVESTAMGLLAGINASRLLAGERPVVPPPETALGGLVSHLTRSDPTRFQPSNINFGLLPPLERLLHRLPEEMPMARRPRKIPKKLRGEYRARIALAALDAWRAAERLDPA